MSNLPPGVTTRDISPDEGQCDVCCRSADGCCCPPCPECGVQGDMNCYVYHGMTVSNEQALSRALGLAADLDNDASVEEIARVRIAARTAIERWWTKERL